MATTQCRFGKHPATGPCGRRSRREVSIKIRTPLAVELLISIVSSLMSISSHLFQNRQELPQSIEFLYTTRYPQAKDPSKILFLDRLSALFERGDAKRVLSLFLTKNPDAEGLKMAKMPLKLPSGAEFFERRITHKDLTEAIGPAAQRSGVVVYVCGVPSMTDDFVDFLRGTEGVEEKRVLCEKWW